MNKQLPKNCPVQDWRNCSAGKGILHQTSPPEFDPWDAQVEQENWTWKQGPTWTLTVEYHWLLQIANIIQTFGKHGGQGLAVFEKSGWPSIGSVSKSTTIFLSVFKSLKLCSLSDRVTFRIVLSLIQWFS